jgi:hypothetical protein
MQVGIKYLAGEKTESTFHTLAPHIPKTTSHFILAFGTKNARALQAKKYFASSLSYEWCRNLTRKFSPGIGADLFYDGATETEMIASRSDAHQRIDDFKTGLHITQRLVYDKFSVAIQEGIYIGLTDQISNRRIYSRLIVRHDVGSQFFLQLAMKSHIAVLDFVEFGVGYKGRS